MKLLAVRVVALVVLLVAGQYVFNAESRAQSIEIEDELRRMVEQNDGLADENRKLRLEAASIQRDDRYLEKIARQEFGMIKKDEVVYHFLVDPPPLRAAPRR